MTLRPATSHSLDGLVKWLTREDWPAHFNATLDRHLGQTPICVSCVLFMLKGVLRSVVCSMLLIRVMIVLDQKHSVVLLIVAARNRLIARVRHRWYRCIIRFMVALLFRGGHNACNLRWTFNCSDAFGISDGLVAVARRSSGSACR